MENFVDLHLSMENFVLTEDHVALLLEEMHQYSYKWREIGTALKFKQSELNNISARPSLIATAPSSFLGVLMNQWVQWPITEHNTRPTLGELHRALGSSLVGLGVLATKLKRKFLPNNMGELLQILMVSNSYIKTEYYLTKLMNTEY